MIDKRNAEALDQDPPQFWDPITDGIIDLPFSHPLGQDILLPCIRSKAMRRLQHISQLSFSHFAFGGKYSRFTHSLQASAQAYREMAILKEKMDAKFPGTFEAPIADAVVVALLLHDLGHAPFSHTFENVMQSVGKAFAHEAWTLRIITEDPEIKSVFERFISKHAAYGAPFEERYGCSFRDMVLNLIDGEVAPELSIYKSFVSGARDCDRTVYLQTDRKVTGAYRRSFNLETILANLDVDQMDMSDDTKRIRKVPVVVYAGRAKEDLAEFLLSWRRQYKKICWHAPARAAEQMLTTVLAEAVDRERQQAHKGIQKNDALSRFLVEDVPSLETFLELTDASILGLVEESSVLQDNGQVQKIARDLSDKRLYASISLDGSMKTAENWENYKTYLTGVLEERGDGTLDDIVFDRTRVRDVRYVPEQPLSPKTLPQVIWVRSKDGTLLTIQDLSAKLRKKPPLQRMFVHAASEEIQKVVIKATDKFCVAHGLKRPSNRSVRSNTARAKKFEGMH